MKTRLIIALILFNVSLLFAQINPKWKFVGPKTCCSPTTTNDLFRSGQIDDITVDPDPSFTDHIIVSSFFAGIWETYNVVNNGWQLLPAFDNYLPDGMECNGVGAVTFRSHTKLFAGGCGAVYEYNYSAVPPTWTKLYTFTSGTLINKIVFMPNDPDHVFLCTSIGLIEGLYSSITSTWTWSSDISGTGGTIHSMAFIEKTSPGYFWYIAGQTTSGTKLLMESDNGTAFTNLIYTTNYQGAPAPNSFAGICLGDQTAANGDRDIYISTAVSNNNWTCNPCGCSTDCYKNDRLLHKLTKNINGSATPTINYLTSTGGEYANTPQRLIIGYDATNNYILTGGVSPHSINLATNTENYSLNSTSIHYDYHGIYINTSVNPDQIFLACDGGFASVSWNSTTNSYNANRLNYGLDICLMNGFSGATEKNLYVYGQQDESYSGLYDESVGRVIVTHSSGENDGGLIDKFDDNRLILVDVSSYSYPNNSGTYYVSVNGQNDFSNSSFNYMYSPSTSPSYYLEPGNSLNPSQVFGKHPFFQQPFRKDRIFAVSIGGSVYQFDPVSKKFVGKVRLQEEGAHFTNSPTLMSEYCAPTVPACDPNNTWKCCPVLNTPYLQLHYLSYQAQPLAMSFSQLDKNKMYVVTGNNDDACCLTASQVVQFIGEDLDSVWWGHNEYQDNTGNPQWQLITPNWLVAPFNLTNTNNEIYHIQFTGVETSNWNKNKIYVTCSSNLPAPFPYKVIVYDGATGLWDNYSDGIPTDEIVTAMIMDHASNDGMYINTDRNVYYRQANMPTWVSYNTGAPGDVLPFVYSRQMEINYRENTVRAGTYGRGIWKSDLVCPSVANLVIPPGTVSDYKEGDDINTTYSTQFPNITNTINSGATVFRATNSITLKPGFTADATATNYFTAYIHGCIGDPNEPYGTSSYNYFRSNFVIDEPTVTANEEEKKLVVSPNPTTSTFSFKTDEDEPNQVLIYNSFGQVVLNQLIQSESREIDLTYQPAGIYFIKVLTAGSAYANKIIKR